MKPIIRIRNLSKRYRIGALNANYVTFREVLGGAMAAPVRRLLGKKRPAQEWLMALEDVCLDVAPGEVVGLVGHNGAGKSTLLKILSRVTEPSAGYFEMHGRVGSLLEIGTGFHPDLTGRENVFLNGAVMGVSRREVARKFDEIVAFSEIERFIDTPVKWYSSGMYLRLGFSTAVHLDPEILVMDEVLAVGDVSFQQKCLDKMHAIMQEGRTILFVSHNMPAVTRLCKRAVWIEHGRVVEDGPAPDVVNSYLGQSWEISEEREWAAAEAPGNGVVRLRRVRVCDETGDTAGSVDVGRAAGIEFTYEVLTPGLTLLPQLDLYNEAGVHIFTTHDVSEQWRRQARPAGEYVSTVRIPGNYLAAGNFLVHASIVSHLPTTSVHTHVPNVVTFQVLEGEDASRPSARGDYLGPMPGLVRPLLNWTTRHSQ